MKLASNEGGEGEGLAPPIFHLFLLYLHNDRRPQVKLYKFYFKPLKVELVELTIEEFSSLTWLS